MADTKISALTAASALAGTEVLPVVQSSTTKKATLAQVFAGIPDGTVAAPSLAFASDADGTGTGIYRPAANQLQIAINGANNALFYTAAGGPTLFLDNGMQIQTGTAGGLKIGTGATEALGLFGGTPVAGWLNAASGTGLSWNNDTSVGRTAAGDVAFGGAAGANQNVRINGASRILKTNAGQMQMGADSSDTFNFLGAATFASPVLVSAGTVSAPGLAFSADADGTGTGLYRSAANEIAVANNGVQTAIFSANNLQVNGIGDIGGSWNLRAAGTSQVNVANGVLTWGDAINIAFNTTTGTKIGTATTQKLAFYNATPVVQPSGAGQVAAATTGATNVAPFGYTTAAQADAIRTLVNQLRSDLVALGLIKGAA